MIDVKDALKDLKDLSLDDDAAYFEAIKKEYLACPQAVKHVKSLGIPDSKIDENLVKISSFVKDINYCNNCPGIDKCQKENPLIVRTLDYRYGVVSSILKPCKRILQKTKLESQFLRDDFDKSWYGNNIDEVNRNEQRKPAFLKFNNYLSNKNDKWLFLTGSMNTGRSFTAAMMAMTVASKNLGPICFINSALRFKELIDLNNSKEKDKFIEVFETYANCNFLVIDDFGTEIKNDLVRTYLLQLIIKRSAKKLFTIFTSDYTIDEIVTLYSQTKAASIEANRIGKILKEECEKEINLGTVSIYK